MAWIELHQSLVEHKKMDTLVRETGLGRDTALGRLCILWLWTLGNRPDGCLSDLDGRRLGQILSLPPRKAQGFLEALEHSGFLDRRDGGLWVHDWEDYAGRLLELRRRDRDRKRLARSQKREAPCPPDGGGTSGAGPALPYPTQPDPTQADRTQSLSSSGAAAGGAGGREEALSQGLRDYLTERGLRAESWLGATPELLDHSRRLTEELFQVFCSRLPTEVDYARIFPLVTDYRPEDGACPRRWDGDREDLLRYAFEQAALSGAGGSWPYIDGVLLRLHQRGITTRNQAEDYELRRDGLIE